MNTRTHHKRLQRGMSLVIALLMLIPMTMLAVTIAKRNNLEELMAGSQRDSQQSLMNAETGLALAGEQLYLLADEQPTQNGLDTINQVLAAQGDIGYTDYALTQGEVTVVVYDNWEASELVNPGFQQPYLDADGHVIVRSTGTYWGGERIVEAIYEIVTASGTYRGPPLVIFGEDDLTISGNPFVWGFNANVHSNSNMHISGNPEIWGTVPSGTLNRISIEPETVLLELL